VDTNIEGVLDEITRVCGVGDEWPPSNSPQRGKNQTSPPGGGIEGGKEQL
jgi:hypothetical protein